MQDNSDQQINNLNPVSTETETNHSQEQNGKPVTVSEQRKPAPSYRGLTRHGKHRVDRYYFATWFDLEFFTKLRKFSRMQSQSIAETIRNNLAVVNHVELDETDRLWMEGQRAKRASKCF